MDYRDLSSCRRLLFSVMACVQSLVAVVMLAAVVVPASAQTLDDLTYITEDYPPFNFERDGKRQGIAVDVLAEMLAQAGAKKTRADIRVWPWARGYETALNEKNTVLFSTTRTEAREKLFKWVGPIMPSRIVLVAKKRKGIKIASIDDLKAANYRIGVVREDVGEKLLDDLGVPKDKTFQANSGMSLAKMLQADRIDMWAYGDQVILWNLKELGYPTRDYEEVYTLNESLHYYFALNKETDDRLVARLQAALDQVKAKGRLSAIVARYR
ncbi:substrate-binding periplasmic protein [Noviherbaspirillum sp.]|uniref:substrate-binding periplasmic protein n=1 Tax=Noviherbaspirillum sp. TaxID=1926288 RepID=UPI002B4809DE|nr:transporter substrate-binding domain-containing protein [Noviherbaspirillum sp.]HJV80760.1 transporter substrate-binding domain-containing protein [Noviherbaspirillum sp.]